MNIPNLLTVARIIFVPGIIFSLVSNNFQIAFILFIAATVTDGLDGFIAKRFNLTTQLGAYLDPIADKLLVGATSVALALLDFFPVWLTVLIISRDLIIVLGIGLLTCSQKNLIIRPHIDGKITTLAQLTAIGFFLGKDVFGFPDFLSFQITTVAALLTTFSGARYMIAGWRIIKG